MPRKKQKTMDHLNFFEKFDPIVDRLVREKASDEDSKLADSVFEECFSDAIVKILPYFDKYKEEENLEVEFRLGYIDDNSFDTNVQEEFYQKIQETLEKSNSFKKDTFITEDTFNSRGKRKSVDQRTKKETIIKKEKLCSLDFHFEGTPFDIRVSFSREVPKNKFSGKDVTYTRQKNRKTYIYKNWNYDLTVVSTEVNTVEEKYYEVEIEANKELSQIYKETRPYEFIHSTLLKLRDLVRMCEEDEGSSKLVFVRAK
jgi:hypothetical protein